MLANSLRKARGFTLIELMIVVLVIAILAAIAYPAYGDYIRKARRADAHDTLLRVKLEQEKWRVSNVAYTAQVGPGGLELALAAGNCFTSPEGHYRVCVVADPAPTATSFTVAATAQGGQTKDTSCPVISLEVDRGVETREPDGCW
jgi:type IV pilus assembly protein PilE